MLFKLLVILVLVQHMCHGNEHNYGEVQAGDKVLYEREIYTRTDVQPKNFTIIFKYIASEQSPNVTCARFIVTNALSTATIDVKTEKDKERTIQAILNIVNGTSLSVYATVYGSSVTLFGANALHALPSNVRQTKPKTFSVIYGHNTTETRNQHVILGQRQSADKLIAFQNKNVTFSYRFAETEFEYRDEHKHITSVQFSFDSPTAIAFVNSTFVKEGGINAIVYDLNNPWFMANMSVYGYDDFDKPNSYKPIIMTYTKSAKPLHGI